MNINLVNRYFWPDESATSLLLTDLAEDLIAGGHAVQVFTSRQLYNQPGAKLPKYQVWHGVKIHRLATTPFGRRSFVGRLLEIMFVHLALRFGQKFSPKPDAWFVMTDPPMILNTVAKLRRKLGGRLVHQVADLYPDVAVALGSLPQKGTLVDLLRRRSVQGLLECDEVLSLGDCMAEVLIGKGIQPEKISVLPPWADGSKLRPLKHEENGFRQELGLSSEDFVVMYSGNMGVGHRFASILEAARRLGNDRKIFFIFIGDGAKKKQIEAYRQHYALERFMLLPYQPKERLKETLAAGDVHLISLDARVQGLIVPSKLAGILAVGRPVIFVGDSKSSVAAAILKGSCGFVVPEGAPARLKEMIKGLASDPELRLKLGKNARRLFEREYNRSIVVPQIIGKLGNNPLSLMSG
jgi:glycosyltransferase involved in cell wall biosynthesis